MKVNTQIFLAFFACPFGQAGEYLSVFVPKGLSAKAESCVTCGAVNVLEICVYLCSSVAKIRGWFFRALSGFFLNSL